MSSSGVVVAANESPSFGGSSLDFLRGDWYNKIFGKKSSTSPPQTSGDPEATKIEYGNDNEDGSDDEDDDEDDDKDKDKKYKNHCVYLYRDKDGKKHVLSKCTEDKKTYKGSKLDGVSSIRVGKDLTVWVYDKKDNKKKYKGKKDKVYNLSGNWLNDTKKIVIQHDDYKGSKESSGDNSKGTNYGEKSVCDPYPWGKSIPGYTTNYTRRVLQEDGTWKCPPHWTDTGCNWDDGEDLDSRELQCAIKTPI